MHKSAVLSLHPEAISGLDRLMTLPSEDERDPVLDLVRRSCDGDEEAWQALWRWMDPKLEVLVRRPRFLARLSQHDDDRRAIVLEVMARLREDHFRRLKLFLKAREQDRHLAPMTWLTVVAKRVGIDYMRSHPDYMDRRRQHSAGDRPGAWVEAKPLPSESRLPGRRPPVTVQGTAAELIAFARRELPEQQQRALALWTEGRAPAEIAAALGLTSAAEAERVVRAAVERLRRQFRTQGAKP